MLDCNRGNNKPSDDDDDDDERDRRTDRQTPRDGIASRGNKTCDSAKRPYDDKDRRFTVPVRPADD